MRRNGFRAGSGRREHGRPNVCMDHPDLAGVCAAEEEAGGGEVAQEEEFEAIPGVVEGESKQVVKRGAGDCIERQPCYS